MAVLKFGGSSVRDRPDAVLSIIVDEPPESGTVVVLSALREVTDLLYRLAESRDTAERLRYCRYIRALHNEFARSRGVAAYHLDALHSLMLRYASSSFPRTINDVVSLGEKYAVVLYTEMLRLRGVPCGLVWAEHLVATGEGGEPDMPRCAELFRRARKARGLGRNRLVLTSGFVGTDVRTGRRTLLGRNGSDRTAAILAVAGGLRDLRVYSDVPGVLTADPRKVPTSRTIPSIHVGQLAELCRCGASVLHPATLQPITTDDAITVRLMSTDDPEGPFTLVVPTATTPCRASLVNAVTSVGNCCLFTVHDASMLRTFAALAAADVEPIFVVHGCFAVHGGYDAEAAAMHLSNLGVRADADEDVAVVTVIGVGMTHRPGAAGAIFAALGQRGVSVRCISQGSPELAVSCVVSSRDELCAVRVLHDRFVITS